MVNDGQKIKENASGSGFDIENGQLQIIEFE